MKRTGIEDIYALTPLQQGMLYHSIEAKGSAMYVVTVLYTIHGSLDVIAFREAWEKLLESHPVLRTSFHWEDLDEPHQVVHEHVHLPFGYEDWHHLSTEEKTESLEELIAEESTQEFDLSSPPLLRLTLIFWGDDHFKMVLSHHHILLDGWCRPLIFDQLHANYQMRLRGIEPTIPASRRFGDYVQWLRAQDLSGAERFWKEELRGFSNATPIGIHRPGGMLAEEKHDISSRQVLLPRETTERVAGFCRTHRLTINTLMQGAWAVLLSQYSGEDDVVFGAISAARPPGLEGIESTVGLFINTLPVRVRMTDEGKIGLWLRELQARQAGARQFDYTPLPEIHRWSDVAAGLPLFESIVVFLNLPSDEEPPVGAAYELQFVEQITRTNFPLYLEVRPESKISLALFHDRTRIDDQTAHRMLDNLRSVIERMISDAERPLQDLFTPNEIEYRRVIYEWNDTRREYPLEKCIHELVEDQAARRPTATAIVDVHRDLSYEELNSRANQLAGRLRDIDVGPGSLVGIGMERNADLIVALLAVLKTGAAYVPMDPDYPAARLRYMAEDAQISTLVTDREWAFELERGGLHVVRLDEVDTATAVRDFGNPDPSCAPESLAYVIYTSGSTGNPKGVMVPHRSVVNLLAYVADALPLTEDDRVLAVTSLSFDIAVLEIFAPLIVGARVLIADRELIVDPPRLVSWLDHTGATVVQATPVIWNLILDADQRPRRALTALCGGERLDRGLARRLLRGIDGPILNMYGPTETTIWSTMHQVTAEDAAPPIGRPIANTQAYVLDARLNPVPAGVAGELYIGGSGVVRGYYMRPRLTAERFVPDPFSDIPGARMYATGDIVRHLPDGIIQFEGRTDQQVKLRGMRIELEEIESWLDRRPEIRSSVVALTADPPEEPRLVAYIVPAGPAEHITDEAKDGLVSSLRTDLQAKLPMNMVPSTFVLLENLPLTPNRKVDRNRLPAASDSKSVRQAVGQLPGNPMERTIAGVWKSVLRVDRIWADSNFFDLGGSSLLAMRAVVGIERETGVRVSPRDMVFQSLAQLAGVVQSRQNPEHAA